MNEHVALDGKLYAGVAGSDDVINTSDYQIADFRGGVTGNFDVTIVDWYGQQRTRKGATAVVEDPRITIGEVAFRPKTFAEVCGLNPVRLPATKGVTAITAGGTEATLATDTETDEVFADNDQVIVADRTGRMVTGNIDNNLSDQECDVDDGAGAAVTGIADVGIMADLDYTSTQYFTRADNVLFDISTGQDYSCAIWFERRRENVAEVLMAKTSSYSGTMGGTTQGWVLYIDETNKLRFAVNDGTDAYILNGTTPILKGETIHVLVTYDDNSASDCKIYLNGYDDTASRTGTLGDIGDCSNALVFSIAAESDGGTPFDGYVIDAAVWDNAVKTAANALTLATTPRTEPTGTPDAWWPFTDDASSSTCDDEATAANSLDLTLVGGTTTNYGTHSRDQIAIISANLLHFNWIDQKAGIGSWSVGDAATTFKTNTQIRKYGSRSLEITNGDGTQAFIRHTVTTVATVMYHFHGWFKSPNTPAGSSRLVDIDLAAAKGITVTQAGATTGATWYEIMFDFEAGDTSTTVDLGTGSTTSTDRGYWDNVQIHRSLVDTGGFETNIAGSSWATTGAPTVDDVDTAEDTGALCYKINSDTPASKYVSQTVTVVSGKAYTFTGRIKCGTAEAAVVVLSGAASATLDNNQETTNWVTVRKEFTASTTSLVIKIYGDGQDGRFDNFSVRKVATKEYHFDSLKELPTLEFLIQFTDNNSKTNQLFCNEVKIMLGPIAFTNLDYVVHDLELMPLNEFAYFVET